MYIVCVVVFCQKANRKRFSLLTRHNGYVSFPYLPFCCLIYTYNHTSWFWCWKYGVAWVFCHQICARLFIVICSVTFSRVLLPSSNIIKNNCGVTKLSVINYLLTSHINSIQLSSSVRLLQSRASMMKIQLTSAVQAQEVQICHAIIYFRFSSLVLPPPSHPPLLTPPSPNPHWHHIRSCNPFTKPICTKQKAITEWQNHANETNSLGCHIPSRNPPPPQSDKANHEARGGGGGYLKLRVNENKCKKLLLG